MIRYLPMQVTDHFYIEAGEVNGSFACGLSKLVSFKCSQNRK